MLLTRRRAGISYASAAALAALSKYGEERKAFSLESVFRPPKPSAPPRRASSKQTCRVGGGWGKVRAGVRGALGCGGWVGRALGAVGGAPACRPAHWCGPRRSSSSSPTTFQHEFLPQLAVAVWCGRISRPREGPRASRRLVAVGAAGRGAVCSPGARSGRASLGCCLAAHATADQLFSVMAKIVLQR